jgi:hypothetical protein
MNTAQLYRRGPAPKVQQESRLRFSGESADALVHAAQLAEAQKRALHETIHHSTQPTKAIAAAAGLSYQFLCNAANPSTSDSLPFARLPLVLEGSDDVTLLRFLAQLQGCDVIRLPKTGASGEDVHRAAATMREFAQFMDASADALVDAAIKPSEFDAIEREGLEAVRAILESIAYHRARVQRPLLETL